MISQQPVGFWPFVLKTTKPRIWGTVLLALALGSLVAGWGASWWNWVEPFLTLLTLGVALLVWYQQIREEWEEDHLPKRFTAHFYYRGNDAQGVEVMRCEKARSTAEGDIRALAQQIGLQMAKLQQLRFVAPEVEVSEPVLEKKGKYVHYTIKFMLTEWPADLKSGHVRIWGEPFMNADGQPSWTDVPLDSGHVPGQG